MINWKAGISMMILLFAAVVHYYSISDRLTSGNVMTTVLSNTMSERSKSVMIDMLKFPEQSKSQLIEFA